MTLRYYISLIPAVLFISLLIVGFCPIVSAAGSEPYEGYYLYLNDYPGNNDGQWSEDVQGITHDESNWFITQASDYYGTSNDVGVLWKIPVSYDLSTVSMNDPGVTRISNFFPDVKPIKNYWHWGSPCYFKYGGIGYILVPAGSILAVFNAQDLSYIGNSTYPPTASNGDPGWVAVDSDGCIYVSFGDSPNEYHKYNLTWPLLRQGKVQLEYQGSIPFYDFNGIQIHLTSMQGGVISESGDLLYVVSGYYDKHYEYEGISVFDRSTNRMIAHSSNGIDPFNYAFLPGKWDGYYQEPEGLTIWDLDSKPAGSTGNAYGQLHVLLLDNDVTDRDEAYLKHYTNTITVDWKYSGSGNGKPSTPFTTISSANTMINSLSWGTVHFGWDGGRILIRKGNYPESGSAPLIFDKQIQLLTDGGTARIRSRAVLSSNGTINIGKSGVMKIY